MTTAFTPGWSLLGGMIIGLAAALLLRGTGRAAGISGIAAGMLTFGSTPGREDDWAWRAEFMGGLIAGGLLLRWFMPGALGTPDLSPATLALAGLLVGFGTSIGGGCTSGHGICGLARLSGRSLVAVVVFMTTAIITVAFTRQLGWRQ